MANAFLAASVTYSNRSDVTEKITKERAQFNSRIHNQLQKSVLVEAFKQAFDLFSGHLNESTFVS